MASDVNTIQTNVVGNNDPRQNKNQPTKTTTPKSIPRGFRKTWSIEQLANIAGLGRNQRQQQEDQRQHETADGAIDTPPGGAVEDPNAQTGNEYSSSPGFLSEEAVATLRTPCGGDIDPVMTAVFKVISANSYCRVCSFFYCIHASHQTRRVIVEPLRERQ